MKSPKTSNFTFQQFLRNSRTWFLLEDQNLVSGQVQCLLATRRHGDVAEGTPGKQDVLEGRRLKKEILSAFPGAQVELEHVDEWVQLEVSLPSEVVKPFTTRLAARHLAKFPTSTDSEELSRILRNQWFRLLKSPVGLAGWKARGVDAKSVPFSEWLEAMVDFFEVETSKTYLDQMGIKLPLSVGSYFRDKRFPDLLEAFQEKLGNITRTHGWFVKSSKDLPYTNTKALLLEKRRGVRIPEVPRYIWHATSVENVERVLRRGIFPRNKHLDPTQHYMKQVQERKYPERIYLATSLPHAKEIASLLQIDQAMASNSIEDVHHGNFESPPFILLRVDTTKVKGANYYLDPDFRKGGVYTYTPIPASAVDIEPSDVGEYREYQARMNEDHGERYVMASSDPFAEIDKATKSAFFDEWVHLEEALPSEVRAAQFAPPPVAPSAEGSFYKNPQFKEVRQFAETGALTNIPAVAADAAEEENLDLPKRQTVSDAKRAPPTPEEIARAPGGKGVSTLNRLVVESVDPKAEKAVPGNQGKMPKNSALEINNSRMASWLKQL